MLSHWIPALKWHCVSFLTPVCFSVHSVSPSLCLDFTLINVDTHTNTHPVHQSPTNRLLSGLSTPDALCTCMSYTLIFHCVPNSAWMADWLSDPSSLSLTLCIHLSPRCRLSSPSNQAPLDASVDKAERASLRFDHFNPSSDLVLLVSLQKIGLNFRDHSAQLLCSVLNRPEEKLLILKHPSLF